MWLLSQTCVQAVSKSCIIVSTILIIRKCQINQDKIFVSQLEITNIFFNCRQTLGEELTFVHLIMSSEEKRKRLEKRHSEGNNPKTLIDIMEVNTKQFNL